MSHMELPLTPPQQKKPNFPEEMGYRIEPHPLTHLPRSGLVQRWSTRTPTNNHAHCSSPERHRCRRAEAASRNPLSNQPVPPARQRVKRACRTVRFSLTGSKRTSRHLLIIAPPIQGIREQSVVGDLPRQLLFRPCRWTTGRKWAAQVSVRRRFCEKQDTLTIGSEHIGHEL